MSALLVHQWKKFNFHRDQVAEARLSLLAAELAAEKENNTVLDKFSELVEKLQASLEMDAATLCAILLKRQQGKRPLFYTGEDPMIAAVERDKQRRRDRRDDRGERMRRWSS